MAVASEQVAHRPEETRSGQDSTGRVALSVEAYVDELLARIQPAPASEARRRTVAQYVQDLIARAFLPAFEVKAFTYGSVPLKTYLPDGDIDLAVFQSKPQTLSLRDSWFNHLSNYLRREAYNFAAPYRIRDVQVIHAEVKLVKCLVDNIVVDISFQSVGGLCTVNFLESIDRRINNHHLFKRSIILIKAWCYYESRLLGAHHGLISTYALETMVLYIFMVYHKTVDTPLKVLHKFLTVFSKFDWDKLCLSLQGPIPLSSFPEPKPLPFPEAEGPPLLREDFMADMRHMYSPPGLPADGPSSASSAPRSFQVKFLNIMDPLLPSNNLGRSVNRSSYSRIRGALDYGARELTAILDKDPAEGVDAAKAFFGKIWNAQRASTGAAKSRSLPRMEPQWQPPASPDARQAGPLKSLPAHQSNNWQSFQIPQMLHTTLAPLLLQQQQQQLQLQQLMVQIGQQHMQQSQAMFHGFPPATQGAAAPTRAFSRANSLPLAEQQEARRAGGQATSRPGSTQQMQAGAAPDTREAASGSVRQNGSSHLRPAQDPEAVSAASPWREGMPPPPLGFPQMAQQRVMPIMGQSAGGPYQLTYPMWLPHNMVQGMTGPMPTLPAGYPGLPAGGLAAVTAPTRHSDPGTSQAAEPADVTLSGDLERLSQHLQSARAMYDAAPVRASDGGARLPDGSYQQQQGQRGPTRSSSAGSLQHMRSVSLPAAAVVRQVYSNGIAPMENGFHHPRRRGHGRPLNGDHGNQHRGAEEAPPQPPSRPASERAASPALPDPAGWPVAGGGDWAPGARPGWSTASEGRPGWVSPVESSLSEQSLASLKGLRGVVENGQATEAVSHVDARGFAPGKWAGDFVLAEEDFPTLPSNGSARATAGQPLPRQGWLPADAKKAAQHATA